MQLTPPDRRSTQELDTGADAKRESYAMARGLESCGLIMVGMTRELLAANKIDAQRGAGSIFIVLTRNARARLKRHGISSS